MRHHLMLVLLVALHFGTIHTSTAQDSIRIKKDRPSKVIRTQPIKVNPPVLIVKPEETQDQPAKIPQKAQLPNKDLLIDLEQLNKALVVSQKYERVLSDYSIFIDERGYDGITFDIIKKQNGDFALVYGASSENLDIYSKGILFTLNSDLSQKGNAMIITKPDEELRDIKLNEFVKDELSILYTCIDSRCVYDNGSRNNRICALKHISIESNGKTKTRNIDDALGVIQIMGIFKPPYCDDITVAYNFDGKGKLGTAGSYLGSHNSICNINKLRTIENTFLSQPSPNVQPGFKSFSLMGNKFLILHDKQLKTPEWNLKDKGLSSGLIDKLVWPLLVVDGFEVANRSSSSDNPNCYYDNDPYTLYTDGALQPNDMIRAIPLKDGSLGILEQDGNSTYFNVFDSELNRVHPHISIAQNIHLPSIQFEELGNDRILFFFKTKSGTNIMEYRAVIYGWKENKVLWSSEEILWQGVENFDWDNIHKLVKIGDNRFVAVSFKEGGEFYQYTQTLEYRILTLNLK